MSITFIIIILLLLFAAIFAYLNHRFLSVLSYSAVSCLAVYY